MKNQRALLVLFLLAFFITSCRDAKNEYYPDGKLKSVVHVRGGEYYGKAIYYLPSGDIELECFYKDNLLQGPLIRFFRFNKKKEVQNYDKGKLDGLSTTYYADGGTSAESTYMNGILNGPYREYHPYNHLKVQGQYLNGFFTGLWLYFESGGDIVGEGHFTHGTGIQRSFFPDGKVSRVVHFKDNLKEGEDIEYSPDGKVVSIKMFSRDSLIRNIR